VDERIICSNCQAALSLPGKAKLSDKVDPLIGQTLGEFEIVEFLGRGGMGAVYKARQASLDRLVAIKVLPRAFSRDTSFVERFGREARAAAAVSHPNIIEIHAVGYERGYQYIAMEFIDGESLGDILKREGRLPADRALALMKQVAAALTEAHGAGILHRDIKPSNVLLTAKGLVKVADFGLAKRPGAELTVTATGAPIGTPLYLSPESARGKTVDARSDLYSLGATFYHALAGRPPFQGDTAAEVILQHAEAQVPSLAQAAPDAPPALCRTVHRLLRKNPGERYPSAEELLAALQRVEARLSVSQWEPTRTMPGDAHPSLAERREAKKQQRRRATLIASGCGVAAIVLVVVLVLVLGAKREGLPPPVPPKPTARKAPPKGKRPTPKPKVTKPTPKPKPKGPAWEAAWTEAEAKAKTLVGEQRFGEAMTTYEQLAGRFEDARLADRAQKAIFAILGQAKTAYQAVEKRAKQLLAEKKFKEARAALRPVIERYGVPGRKEQAEELVRQIDAAEKAERTAAAQAAQEAAKEAERKRREAEREKRQEAEARYAKALKPIEGMIGAWDFRGAAAELAKLDVGGISVPRELAKRLATRRDEVARLARLQAKMIQRINTAKPRLQRRSLLISGINADLVKADEKGITAKLATAKAEGHTWASLSSRSVQQLIQRTIDRKSADDCLAAGILALTMKDPRSAERHFGEARSLGAKTFARAKALLDKGEFKSAESDLTDLEKKYATTPWLAAHKDDFAAAREAAKSAIAEAEAEKLYKQAVRLFKKKELWELKPIIEKLKTDYTKTRPVTDADRKPSFTEMAKAVEGLGKFLTVRKDGKGDFKSIQAAIDAAPAGSLIEIIGEGPYNEQIAIATHKEGLTIRGRKGSWPKIILGSTREKPHGLSVEGPKSAIERLVLVHPEQEGRIGSCLFARGSGFQLRWAIVYGENRSTVLCRAENQLLANCIIVGPSDAPNAACSNCLWLDGGLNTLSKAVFHNVVLDASRGGGALQLGADCQLRSCTILRLVDCQSQPNALVDCIILGSVRARQPNTRIEHCNVFSREPRFLDFAEAGRGCIKADPQFRDPKNRDYRLKPTSPCRRRASDGGDIGCRFTPEMLEMLKRASKLRKKGIIKF